jgi:HEAT repeat protein
MNQTPGKSMKNRSPDTLKSLDALEKFTLPIIDYFTKALNHEDKWVRYLAAEALGSIGNQRSIEPLNQLRVDTDPDLRLVSFQALKNIRSMQEILTDSRKMGCDTCLIRYIAEEVLVQRNRQTSPQRTENCR